MKMNKSKLFSAFMSLFKNRVKLPKGLAQEYGNLDEVEEFINKLSIQNWYHIVSAPLIDMAMSYFSIFYIFLQSQLNDSFINNNSNLTVSLLMNYILYQVVVKTVLSQLQVRLSKKTIYNNPNSTKNSILERILSLDYNFFEANKNTQISQCYSSSFHIIYYLTAPRNLFNKVLRYVRMFGELVFIMKMCPWSISLLSICLSAFTTIACDLMEKKRIEMQLLEGDQIQYQNFFLDETLKNIQLIKQFGKERDEIHKLNSIINNNISYYKNRQIPESTSWYDTIVNFASNHFEDIFTLALVLQLFMMRKNDPLATQSMAADFSLILTYSFAISKSVDAVYRYFTDKNDFDNAFYIASILKLSQFLKHKSTIPTCLSEKESLSGKELFEGNIAFNNVSFKYPQTLDLMATMNQIESRLDDEIDDQERRLLKKQRELKNKLTQVSALTPEKNVLEEISFDIKSGQFVSFVGKSGSGKSTIAKLIQRFYNITSGDILFDGKSMNDTSIVKLKNNIGFVSQDPCLLDTDVKSNIIYGSDDEFTEEYLKEICDISGVSEFIFNKKKFPDGLKTLVGQNGAKLSGGQKQRIAIARALFKKPQILILDEATSSLDAQSEYVVQSYIDKLVEKRGMTIIVIAHRLSTIVKSDTIYVMENGKITEQGTHEELLKLEGYYKQLVSHQIHT